MDKIIGFTLRLFHSRLAARTLLFILFTAVALPLPACTVFLLVDKDHTYFYNNEDFTNPNGRIWFIPKGSGHFGCAYVGFDDGESQGGINTEGLAFDWVTVDSDSYTTDPGYVPEDKMIRVDGNTSQKMLEQCKTTAEAIKFYQTHREPAFAKTTLFIADKSGASVIIGSKDGKLYFETSQSSRGLGYGETTFQKLYKATATVDATEGVQILKQCVAPGDGGTKYSNSYDLRTGEIVFFNFSTENGQTRLNLSEELKKESHYYETAQIAAQSKEALRPLKLNMNRNILFEYKPLPNQEEEITAKVRNIFSEVTSGKLRYDDLTEGLTNNLKGNEASVKSMVERLGKLNSLELIHKEKNPEFIDYSYIVKFEKVTILWQFLLNDKNKVIDFNTLSAHWIR